jgi:hypothetical protein
VTMAGHTQIMSVHSGRPCASRKRSQWHDIYRQRNGSGDYRNILNRQSRDARKEAVLQLWVGLYVNTIPVLRSFMRTTSLRSIGKTTRGGP